LLLHQQDRILVTGASGFIGSRLVQVLLDRGFCNLRCFVRPSSDLERLERMASRGQTHIDFVKGNLLSRSDCDLAARDAVAVYHLAAGRGEKSFPDAFMNSVVTTRNLLESCRGHGCLRRFVNVSSFAVYSNDQKWAGNLLEESCPVEKNPHTFGDAYSFAKAKQDEIVSEYGRKHGIPYVIVRPGFVYGPGNRAISGRVGIAPLGIFLHLGGSNPIPFTYVDNCAEAIALAGWKPGIDGEVFNVVDDQLPSSRKFLRLYKKNVRWFPSVYVPHALSYTLCYLWEKYSAWSQGQFEPVYNRKKWRAYWKKTGYSNDKIKRILGWTPVVSTSEGLRRYFQYARGAQSDA
jgi:nucleoside-diphosphate-sugar epimerase